MLLYDAVFQGMKGDDSHSATDLESFNSLIEDIFQHIELMIDFDTDRLKTAFATWEPFSRAPFGWRVQYNPRAEKSWRSARSAGVLR